MQGSKRCNLCLEEKLNIFKGKDKRLEIILACKPKIDFR